MNHFSTLLFMRLFSLWKLSKKSYICNRNLKKFKFIITPEKGIQIIYSFELDKYFAQAKTKPFSDY